MPSLNASNVGNVTPGVADNLKQAFDKYNAHWHDYDALLLTNRLGVTVVAGDVCAIDTATDSSVVAADVAGSLRPFVVARASILNTATGECQRAGVASVKTQGSITRYDYVRKSATARAIESTGVTASDGAPAPNGTLGLAVATTSGGFTQVLWYPHPVTNGLLFQVAAPATVVNTVTPTAVFSQTLRGGNLGAAGELEILVWGHITGRSLPGTGTESLTLALTYGGVSIGAFAILVTGRHISGNSARLTTSPFQLRAHLLAANAAAAQVTYARYTGSVLVEVLVSAVPNYVVGGAGINLLALSTAGATEGATTDIPWLRTVSAVNSDVDQVLALTATWTAADINNTVTIERLEVRRVR